MSRKSIILTACAVVLACGLTSLGWFYGRPAYREYRENRAIGAAQAALQKRDFGTASVAARKTLQYNPRNVTAWQILAQLAEGSRSAQALEWRKQVAELSPTLENKYRLASCALKFETFPFPTASRVLEEALAVASNNPVTHALTAEMATRLNQPTDALRHYVIASQLDPTNAGYRFNVAVLRLESPEASQSTEARQTLESMREDPAWREAALRWLLANRLKHEDIPAARKFSQELIQAPQHTFQDQLQHLLVLKKVDDIRAFDEALSSARSVASTNGSLAYAFATWTLQHGDRETALRFLDGLPEPVRTSTEAEMAYVECYVDGKDWTTLDEFLQGKKWGQQDFLRLGILSRAAGEQGQEKAAETRWRSAVREANNRLPSLVSLLGLAKSLGREAAREELLWLIYQRFPREKWALLELDRKYTREANTRGLHRVYSILGADTNNLVAQNNLAATSLLLNQDLGKAHAIALDIYNRCPTNPTIISTYAFSLHQQGKTREGLEALEKLEDSVREKPPVALYYGVLLASVGQTNEAVRYIKAAEKSLSLPEEKVLAQNVLQ